MKKFSLLLAAVAAFAMVSCCGSDYRTLIPADAVAVVSVNPASMAQKASVGDFTQSVFYKIAEKFITDTSENNDLTPEERDYVLSLVANPEEAGIDMRADAYLFVSMPKGEDSEPGVGAVFKVKNKGKAAKMVELLKETDEERVFLEKNAMLIYYGSDDENMPHALFANTKEQSLVGQPHMATFFRGGNDIQFALHYGAMMAALDESGMASQMPGMDFLSKMVMVSTTNFELGRVVARGDVFFTDDAARESYEKLVPMYARLDNGFLKMLPEKNIATIATGLHGAEVYGFLNQIPMYATLLAMTPQAKTIVSALDGDIALAFHGMDMAKQMPLLTLVAQVNDPSVLETVQSLLPKGFDQVAFGVKENMFYATTDAGVVPYLTGEMKPSTFQERVASLFGGAYSVMHVDFKLLSTMLSEGIAAKTIPVGAAVAIPVLDLFESFEMKTPEMNHFDMVLHMTDKEKNAAEVLYKTIEGYAQVAGMAML